MIDPIGAAVPLVGKRLVITGASGQIAGAIAKRLAPSNEVYGVARFGDEDRRRELEAAGVITVVADVTGDDYTALPTGIDHLLHLAAYLGPNPDTDYSIDVNAVTTGRLLSHYRDVDSALVMSTCGVYRANPDPLHLYLESEPLGDPMSTASPAYGVTKVAQEAVAKFAAREFGVRVVIGRMNASYGPGGGLPSRHLDRIVAGETIVLRNDPVGYTPIYEDDIADHAGALLAAATTSALVVNYGGDELVTSQEWCAYLGELVGAQPVIRIVPLPGSQLGTAAEPTRRLSITGPDSVHWRDGMRRMVEARLPAYTPRPHRAAEQDRS